MSRLAVSLRVVSWLAASLNNLWMLTLNAGFAVVAGRARLPVSGAPGALGDANAGGAAIHGSWIPARERVSDRCQCALEVRSKKDPGRRPATAGGECRLVAMTGGLSVSGGFTGGSPGSGGSTGGFAGPGGFPGGLSGPGGFTGGSPGPGGSTGGCFGSGGPPGGRCDSRERARNGAWMPARPAWLALHRVPRLQL